MKMNLFALFFLLATLLIGCSQSNVKEQSIEINKADVKKLVNDLSLRKLGGSSGSIFSEELLVQDSEGKTLVYDLPKDEFFISIAPYIKRTHL